MSQPITVDILSDDEECTAGASERVPPEQSYFQNDTVVVVDDSTPLPTKKKRRTASSSSNPTTVLIDDDPTTRKPYVGPTSSISFIADTPFSDVSIAKCSKRFSSFNSIPEMIEDTPISELSKSSVSFAKHYKESPGDWTPSCVAETPISDLSKHEVPTVISNRGISDSQLLLSSVLDPKFPGINGLICLESENEYENGIGLETRKQIETSFAVDVANQSEWSSTFTEPAFHIGNFDISLSAKDNSLSNSSDTGISLVDVHERLERTTKVSGGTGRNKDDRNQKKNSGEAKGRKRMSKEDRIRLKEEKKLHKEQEKLRKASEKAEAAELKKLQKERLKWENGKFALKSIVAEIDTRVVEIGSVGGHLLTRFAEKGVSYRVTSNPIERSIVWTMTVPEYISQVSSEKTEVQYVLLVYEAEEFCNLIMNGSLMDHVSQVQHHYPYHTICYLTNRLMALINKREQEKYKNRTNCTGWRCPPIEEVLSKLITHFTRVHTRHCVDEAELAEHAVGLTCSLATCQFRKKSTWLSVNANGSIIPKDSVDRNLIKKNVWLKALVAIPKVQPRFAIAIWKEYPTMKSLLSVYLDPSKTVHEKEFLLKDLITEGLLGDDRRLGEVCSKRVYRILMAQSGNILTDDVENGADFFSRQSS